jgi:ABC-type thiamin/hydroxymethylpyrimidine transport system permease subunit
MIKNWQISELLLLLALSVPVIFGLAYILWSVNPLLAIVIEFSAFLALIVTWFKLFDHVVSHHG